MIWWNRKIYNNTWPTRFKSGNLASFLLWKPPYSKHSIINREPTGSFTNNYQIHSFFSISTTIILDLPNVSLPHSWALASNSTNIVHLQCTRNWRDKAIQLPVPASNLSPIQFRILFIWCLRLELLSSQFLPIKSLLAT